MTTYRGLSTLGRSKKFRMTDIELVKRDLMNHFQIRKGEKLMNPEFGSVIWSVLFDPLNAETKRIIIDDVTTITKYDPRITVNEIILTEQQNGLQINITLTYVPTNQVSTMMFTFDRDSNSVR